MYQRLSVRLLIGLILIASCRFGTGAGEKKVTPKEFVNNVQVEPSRYLMDKDSIELILKNFKDSHQQSFHSKEYFDSTIVKVDTILYSSDFDKVVVFVLTKNPIERQLIPNTKHKFYYDAVCYLGIRKGNEFELKCLRIFMPLPRS